MKAVFLLIIIAVSFTFKAQPIDNIPKNLYERANTAKNADYLSKEEKEVVLYMNLARLDGKWFIKNIIEKNKEFVNQNSKRYVNSLIKDLKSTPELKALNPSKNLTRAARYHAKDMGKTGKTGHRSSDGTETFKRIKRFAKGGYMAENCQYGYYEPLKIVLDLLIDDGIHSLGHRKNILNKNYTYVGVAIEPHKKYGVNCVQDFSDSGD